ncbi:MAG: hypothetical protein KKB50_09120 [Planctomycetes bacterium]|nr:hypothetical protein [Planctomycetota bacterium]
MFGNPLTYLVLVLSPSAATFTALDAPPLVSPAQTGDSGCLSFEQSAVADPSRAVGKELVQGWIEGTVYVDSDPVSVRGSVAVRGGLIGPSIGSGIALAQPEPARNGGDPQQSPPDAWPVYATVFIVPDSWVDEWVVLNDVGDSAAFDVRFGNGSYLHYDIEVVCANPPVFGITLSGKLKSDRQNSALPWHRGLNLVWHADGTITGDGFSAGQLSSGETYLVPVSIEGSYVSAHPRVPVPAKVSGKLTITRYDHETGYWEGYGSREVTCGLDAVDPIDK